MEENVENLEIIETTETTVEVIDYGPAIAQINDNLILIQENITFLTFIVILWVVLQNFVFKKGWTK